MKSVDEIDLIMSEMEFELNENGVNSEEVQVPIPKPRQSIQVPDDTDAKSRGIIR